MLLSILKTTLQIVNMMLWLIGVSVSILVIWIISDYDVDSLSGTMMEMLEMMMIRDKSSGGGWSGCHVMTREVVEDVTLHVSDKLCSILDLLL